MTFHALEQEFHQLPAEIKVELVDGRGGIGGFPLAIRAVLPVVVVADDGDVPLRFLAEETATLWRWDNIRHR